MTKVAIATCTGLPEPDPDETILVAALERAGARVRMLAWDADGSASAPEPDETVVIRSTWNYYTAPERFLDWVERTAETARLVNPASVVRDNARKTYLGELAMRGIDVVPTEYVRRGERRSVGDVARERGWTKLVIKPVVSAGSWNTRAFDLGALDDAERFLAEATAERDMMLQRWMSTVETHGERALVWIDGALSHAVRKSPRFSGGAESVSAAIPIADDERAFAERVLSIPREALREARAEDLLYARVDVLRDEDGVLHLMELELIEPSLFLVQSPEGLGRLVRGIVDRASRRRDEGIPVSGRPDGT